MTRKHYTAIAEALAQATIDSDMSDSAIKALDAAINNLSDFFPVIMHPLIKANSFFYPGGNDDSKALHGDS